MKHFLLDKNIGICVGRQAEVVGSDNYDTVFICENIVDTNLFRRGGHIVCPLYLYPGEEELGNEVRVNLKDKFLKYINDIYAHKLKPEQIFGYIYSILHSPIYRCVGFSVSGL
jgi:predicted helicase